MFKRFAERKKKPRPVKLDPEKKEDKSLDIVKQLMETHPEVFELPF